MGAVHVLEAVEMTAPADRHPQLGSGLPDRNGNSVLGLWIKEDPALWIKRPQVDRAACPMPALVMIDIILSSSTGFPVLDWLRENGHLDNEKVRVIMLTSSSRTEHIQEALRLGALSYLVKSPCPDNVIELLSKLLLQRSPIAPDRSNTQPPAQI